MRLHHKLIITFSMVSLAVLATGAAGLFVVDKVGGDIGLVLEGKVGVADASSEIVSSVESTESLLREYMLTEDMDRMHQIEKEMENYHKIDDMWMHAIIYGTESREFIESEEYPLWLEYGYGAKDIIIRKADPEVISIIEELDITHEKFHETAHRLMDLHREELRTEQDRLDTYDRAKEYRHSVRNTIIAQGDYLILGDMWRAEYEGKEALFQYRDKEHMEEWIEAIETLHADIVNSNFTPEVKNEMQNYSAEYLLLARTMSRHALRLSEINAEMQTQMKILDGHARDMDANVAEIRAAALAARSDAKKEIQAYIIDMLLFLAALTVIGIVFIMCVGYFTSNFISQPIIKLRDATKKTGEGDFDVKIDIDRRDEIGELAAAFNKMTADLKTYHDELLSAKEYTDTVLDSISDAISIIDVRDFKIVSVNKGFLDTLGLREEDVIGRTCFEVTHHRDSPCTPPDDACPLLDALETGKQSVFEHVHYRKTGEKEYVEVSCYPIKDDKGEVIQVVHVARDIAERKQADEALRESEGRYRELFENFVDGVYTLDGECRFTSVNRAIEEMTGYRKEELLGKKKLDIVSDESRGSVEKRFASLLEGEEPLQIEFQIVAKDGELVEVEANSAPIKKEGSIVGVLESVRDFSFRKALKREIETINEELARYSQQLEQSNHLKDLFTDIMRHDLLNPVGIIKNLAVIVTDDERLKDSKGIHMIWNNARKLEEMIQAASLYAKLESADDIVWKEMDLNEIIKDAADSLKPYFEGKHIELEYLPKGEYIASTISIVEEVFVNLLSNTVKYSPEDTKVTVNIEDAGENWRVAVADQGFGVPDEYKELIFDRFTRKDKRGVRGTGLGLAIVKRIVEIHGGKTWVKDNPKGGSIFYVEIPKAGV